MHHNLERKHLRSGDVQKVLALIKSLIYEREEEEDALEARLNKINQSRLILSAVKAYSFSLLFILDVAT